MLRGGLQVRDELRADARWFASSAPEYSQGRKGAIIGRLNEAFGSDENRRVVISWLFRSLPSKALSSRELSRGEWYALDRWIGAWHAEGEWHVALNFYPEAHRVLIEATRALICQTYALETDGLLASAATLPGHKVIGEVHDEESH